MLCPYCGKDMEKGSVSQDVRYALMWTSHRRQNDGFFPKYHSIKLTSLLKGGEVIMYHCPDCRKFLIDEDDITC